MVLAINHASRILGFKCTIGASRGIRINATISLPASRVSGIERTESAGRVCRISFTNAGLTLGILGIKLTKSLFYNYVAGRVAGV